MKKTTAPLLALSVGVGLGVLAELMEEEVVEVVGAKGSHNPKRARGVQKLGHPCKGAVDVAAR